VCGYATLFTTAFASTANPEELGNYWTTPTNAVQVCLGIQAYIAISNTGTSDFDVFLIRDPFGSPSVVASRTVDVSAELPFATARGGFIPWSNFATYTLDAGTVYGVARRATGAGNVSFARLIAPASGALAAARLLSTFRGMTRDGGSGVYTAADDRFHDTIPVLRFDDGSASGGLRVHPGLSGGLNG